MSNNNNSRNSNKRIDGKTYTISGNNINYVRRKTAAAAAAAAEVLPSPSSSFLNHSSSSSSSSISYTSSQNGVSAVIAVVYVFSLLSAVFVSLVTVTSSLCEIKAPVLLGSASVLLLQASIPAAVYDGHEFSVLALIADAVGVAVSIIGSIFILNEMWKACGGGGGHDNNDDSEDEQCSNSTGTLTPFTWASIWAISLIVAFILLFILTCVRMYHVRSLNAQRRLYGN